MTTQTLHNWMGKNSPYRFDGEIGIEIETEARDAYDVPAFDYWTTHTDGSLRNFGIEYVLAQPLDFDYKAYKEALKEFADKTKKIKFLPSVYTSVHVHFNQKNRTLQQLFNFITLYLLFEETLTRYCGNDRNGNLFCLKTSNAERNLNAIVDLCEQMDRGNTRKVQTLNANVLKYAGLNIAPLRTFGSLEIRTYYGTEDVGLIDRWVGLLCKGVYHQALKFKNPVEIIDQFNKVGYKAFFDACFGEYARFLNPLDEDFEKTLWYASTVASSVLNWDTFGKEKKVETFVSSFKTKSTNLGFYHSDEDALSSANRESADYFTRMGELNLITSTTDL